MTCSAQYNLGGAIMIGPMANQTEFCMSIRRIWYAINNWISTDTTTIANWIIMIIIFSQITLITEQAPLLCTAAYYSVAESSLYDKLIHILIQSLHVTYTHSGSLPNVLHSLVICVVPKHTVHNMQPYTCTHTIISFVYNLFIRSLKPKQAKQYVDAVSKLTQAARVNSYI